MEAEKEQPMGKVQSVTDSVYKLQWVLCFTA